MLLPEHIRSPDPSILLSDNYVVLDFETTNIEFGDAAMADNRLLLSAWKPSKGSVHYCWGGEFDIDHLVRACEEADIIVAHNSKMELKWLHRAGIDLSKVVPYCTMIGDYVLLGNRRKPLGLGPMAERYGFGTKDPYVDKLMRSKICPSEIPRSFLLARCIKDVQQTEAIFLKQRKALHENNLLPVMFTRCIFTPVLADIEMQGMQLDHGRVNEAHDEAEQRLLRVDSELNAMAPGVNMNSPLQLGELLYNDLGFKELRKGKEVLRTATGRPLTDATTISKLSATNKKQRKFKELITERALVDAQLSKALRKFKECCDNDELLYARFNQTVTATHRLSSSGIKYNVQFQNLARQFKPLFKAKQDGWLMAEDDGAQIEFRVAGFLGQDQQAYEDIINEEDVHSYTASVLTDAGQTTSRQDAKPHTFKPLYGGQSGTKAERAYYAAFREKYPGITQTQEAWKREVVREKRLVLGHGLAFYWPDTKISSDGYVSNSTAICNYPVQNLATAEIVPTAITFQWHRMRRAGMAAQIVNTVHDSSISECPPPEVEQLKDIATEAYTSDVYRYLDTVYDMQFNFPLGIGHKAGEHWAEGEEVKMQVVPPYGGPQREQRRANTGNNF